MGVLQRFYLKATGAGQVETLIRLTSDGRGILTGRVISENSEPQEAVCVLLYDTLGKQEFAQYQLIDSVFTDENGTFILGPIQEGCLYAVYVYQSGVKVRQLELKG